MMKPTMSDLTERLETAITIAEGGSGQFHARVIKDAAARIDALETALRTIQQATTDLAARELAREALSDE